MITKRKIIIPIFRIKLTIIVLDEMSEGVVLYPSLDINSDGNVLDYSNGEVSIFITPKDYSIIAHECLHVVNSVWLRIGYNPQKDNDEVDAYLLDYIMSKVLDVVKKHNELKQC